MIRTDALSKVYGARSRAVTALSDVSLEIGPGVWGVVGPNGAGKTTFLGLVLGCLHATDGSVRIDDLTPRRYLRRHGAGYLPERFRLPGAWPVRSALRSLARLDGLEARAADRAADAALDRLGLAEHADRPVGQLSRGLTQRVGLAQVLLSDHRLVVLDEPTEGLDPLWRVRFRELVTELAREERTVLLASHELAEVERLADRVVVLDRGRVRDVMEPGGAATGPIRYRVVVTAADEAIAAAFPGASKASEPERGSGRPPGPADPGAEAGDVTASYEVSVADAAELSHRLAALLDAGGRVHAVVPLEEDLETRVRQRLEDR